MNKKLKIGLIAAAALLIGGFFVISGNARQAKAATTMTFTATQNGSASPGSQTFTISNTTPTGGSALTYSAYVKTYTPSGTSWLSISPTSGTIAYGSSATVTVSVNNTSMTPGTYAATIEVDGASEDGSGAINSPFQYVNVTLTISSGSGGSSNCNITSFTATPSSVTSGNSTLLQYAASNCWTMVLNGGEFTNRSMPSSSGAISTSPLTQTTTYTLTGTDNLGRQATKSVTVTVTPQTNSCTINVSSTGSSTGYTYTLSGPGNINGAGDTTFSNQPTGTWTFTYTGGAVQSPTSITPSSSQNCGTNSTITFTVNFPSALSCTVVVSATGNSTGYTYTLSGPRNINGAGDTTFSNQPTGTWTFTYTGGAASPPQNITPAATQTCGANSTITFHPNFQGTTNCQITSFSASPSTVFRGNSTLLTWSTNGCNTVYLISSSAFNAGILVASSGSAYSSALNYDMPFTLDGCNTNGSSCDSKSILVTVSNPGYFPCTLNSFTYAAGSGSNYTLSWDAGGCGGVVLTGGSFGDGLYNGSPIGSTTISVPRTTQYCAVGRDFSRNLYGGTKCLIITIAAAPGPPTNVVAANSSTNSSVPCGQVLITWTAGTNATSYNLYRNTSSGSAGSIWNTTTGTTYTDSSGTAGTTYYYWVQSANGGGTSAQVISNAISPIGCQVNLSTGGKNLTKVNGQNYTYNSSCISSQSGSVNTIQNGDDLTFNINICNTGTANANNVSVSDDLTGENLKWHGTAPSFVGGTATSYSVNGNVITFNFGTIAAGTKGTVTFDLDANAPSGNTQSLLRLRNIADITYTSSAPAGQTGCIGSSATTTNPCVYNTGYIVFYNGNKAPTIKEINP